MSEVATRLDLRPDHWAIVRDTLQGHVPNRQVVAFGSRATWTAKDYSDLDLAIMGDESLPLDVSSALAEAFSESDLPFKVDIVNWAGIDETFRDIIRRDGLSVQIPAKGSDVANRLGRSTKPRSEWQKVRLGDLIEIKHGFAFKGEFFHDDPPGDFLLTPGNFAIGGGFQWRKQRYYRDGPVPHDFILCPGDILVTMTDLSKDANTLGYSAVVPNSAERLLHNQRLGKVIIKSNKIATNYVHWLMRSPDYRNEILASYTGSTVKHTSPKKILAYEFDLPPLDEQTKIADVLDSLDDKMDLNCRMNETLEAMARAIFKDWFVEFGPTRAKAGGRAPYLAPELWDLFPDSLDYEGRPVGWTKPQASDLFEFNPSETIRKGAETPYLDMAALPTIGPVSDAPSFREYKAGTKFRDGDTLFARITPCLENGKTAYVFGLGDGVIGAGSTEFIVMRSREPVPAPISYLLARDLEFRRHAERNMTGTSGRQRTNAEALMRYELAAPSDDSVWAAFGNLLEPLIARIICNAQEVRTLAQTRDLLLPKLMSGAIHLREAEQAFEAVT